MKKKLSWKETIEAIKNPARIEDPDKRAAAEDARAAWEDTKDSAREVQRAWNELKRAARVALIPLLLFIGFVWGLYVLATRLI